MCAKGVGGFSCTLVALSCVPSGSSDDEQQVSQFFSGLETGRVLGWGSVLHPLHVWLKFHAFHCVDIRGQRVIWALADGVTFLSCSVLVVEHHFLCSYKRQDHS